MSFLLNKSCRALYTISCASRLHFAKRIQHRFFSDKSDEVSPPVEENISNQADNIERNEKLGGFAKAFEKFTKPEEEVKPVVENLSFNRLFRESKFVDVSLVRPWFGHFEHIL